MRKIAQAFTVGIILIIAAAWLYYGQRSTQQNSWYKQEQMMERETIGPKKLILSEDEWKKRLSSKQFHVLRKKGTEPAFSSELADNKEPGVYHCAACNLPLFSSDAKFDSGTGWPSFWELIKPLNMHYEEDFSLFTKRVEVLCSRCNSHIGHVFKDGPPPTGLRYCVNAIALKFVPSKEENNPSSK